MAEALDPIAIRRGATIKALREAYGLTAEELAQRSNVSKRWIIYCETGQYRATIPTCRKIAQALELPLAAIALAPADSKEAA